VSFKKVPEIPRKILLQKKCAPRDSNPEPID
jgi:hypothetical protein